MKIKGNKQTKEILLGFLSSNLGILSSRFLGMIREVLIAHYFGANYKTDAFFLAWKIPNIFRRVLGEGGLNPILIPFFSKRKYRALIGTLFLYISLVSLGVALLLSLFSPQLVSLFSSKNADREFIHSAIDYLRILSFYIFFASINAFFMSFLQYKEKFFISYTSQTLFNAVLILFLILFHNSLGVWALVIGSLVGGFFQVVYLGFWSFYYKIPLKPITCRFHKGVKRFFKHLIPSLGSTGIGQISTLAEAFFATFYGEGILSSLYYAYRLYQFPASLLGVSLSNLILSKISKENNTQNFRRWEIFGIPFLLSAPVSLFLFFCAEPIIKLLYYHGAFSEKALKNVEIFLKIYSFGLPFFAMYRVALNKLYVKSKYFLAFIISFLWFITEILVAGIGIFIFNAPAWIIPISSVAGTILAFLAVVFLIQILIK
jgi:putative peptidoglycan lipid II flippase